MNTFDYVDLGGDIRYVKDSAGQAMLAPEETSTTASKAYEVGDLFRYDGKLYRVKTNIAQGGTITIGTNCKETIIEEEIDKKISKPSGIAANKFLKTDSNGDATWGDAITPAQISTATDAWLAQNITNPASPPLDSSLTLANAAAPADKVGDLKSAIECVSESKFLSTEYRQGFLSTGGTYNTSNSGKSYAVDISSCTGNIYVKLQGNNNLRYGMYTKTRDEVTSSDVCADGTYHSLWTSSNHPTSIKLEYEEYHAYKTLMVTSDYNNSTPAKIIVYEEAYLKADMQNEIEILQESLDKDIVPLLFMEAGNINVLTGKNDSSSTRIRSNGFLPKFAGVLSSTNSDGGFYLYAYEETTFKGGYNGSIITTNSTEQRTIDVGALSNKYPAYRFRIVYVIDNGTATVSNVSELRLTNVFYSVSEIPTEKIRVLFNNLGMFNMGSKVTKMSTEYALAKMENYKQFYAEYQPNICSFEEFPMDVPTADPPKTRFIDSGESVDPNAELYPYIYPYTTGVYQYATIKSDYNITNTRNIAIQLLDENDNPYPYGLRGVIAAIKTPAGRTIGVMSTVFDVNGTVANRSAQMAKAIDLMSGFNWAFICVDTNIRGENGGLTAEQEFIAMQNMFTTAGYQMANGGFYPRTDTCPGASFKPIDNIFVRGNAKMKSFIVPDVLSTLSSDHLPVISDITLFS